MAVAPLTDSALSPETGPTPVNVWVSTFSTRSPRSVTSPISRC